VGNAGDNSVSSYRLYASETQQLADATPICYLCAVARGCWGSLQPMTGRLATHPTNITVKMPPSPKCGSAFEKKSVQQLKNVKSRVFWILEKNVNKRTYSFRDELITPV